MEQDPQPEDVREVGNADPESFQLHLFDIP